MTRIAVVSARRSSDNLAQFCASDFEDAVADATGARIYTPLLPGDGAQDTVEGDLAIMIALSFRDLDSLLAATPVAPGTRLVGYVFGAYLHDLAPRPNPVVNVVKAWRRRRVSRLETLYLGIDEAPEAIARKLNVRTVYLPMAANGLAVDAQPLSAASDRPIAVCGFGRQHIPTMEGLADRLNAPESRELFYATNFLDSRRAKDAMRYRAMFWQVLRQSRIATAFDQVIAPNESGRHVSHVGPRWFESLAAGTVVVGYAPQSAAASALLDWEDATIELSRDPAAAVEEVMALLSDRARLEVASRRNLHNILGRHDWRHRLKALLDDCDLSAPERLTAQLATLDARSSELA